MPEEARLLLEKGIVFVVDDVAAHERMQGLESDVKASFLRDVEAKRMGAAMAARQFMLEKKHKHFEKVRKGEIKVRHNKRPVSEQGENEERSVDDDSLFGPSDSVMSREQKISDSRAASVADGSDQSLVPYDYTPTTSCPPLVASPAGSHQEIPEATNAYYLFKHLHSKGYFMSPGLRFGCQFVAYPGDPLRFHSHFLSVSKDWDEPIDLIDIVGGGRLGTGVKKGFLLGGVEDLENHKPEEQRVRTFCFEWAAM